MKTNGIAQAYCRLILEIFSQRAEKLAIAKEKNFISNYDEDTQSLQPCDKEEIYAKEMSKTRLKKLINPAIDADAIEIVSYVSLDLGVDEQRNESGKRKDMR